MPYFIPPIHFHVPRIKFLPSVTIPNVRNLTFQLHRLKFTKLHCLLVIRQLKKRGTVYCSAKNQDLMLINGKRVKAGLPKLSRTVSPAKDRIFSGDTLPLHSKSQRKIMARVCVCSGGVGGNAAWRNS